MTGAKLLLLHVADGWVARNFNQLKLAESEEMKGDREYLEKNRSVRLRGETDSPSKPCWRLAIRRTKSSRWPKAKGAI